MDMAAIGKVQGILAACEALNEWANHSSRYMFEVLARNGSLVSEQLETAVLREKLLELPAPPAGPLELKATLIPVNDWIEETRRICDKWFFFYEDELHREEAQKRRTAWWSGVKRSVSGQAERRVGGQNLLSAMCHLLRLAIGEDPEAVFSMENTTNAFYGLEWDDLVYVTRSRIFWLHFSFSD